MRLVLDTNVVVSALLWGGNPERLIEAAGDGTFEVFTSPALFAELAGLLGRAKLAGQFERRGLSAEEVLARYLELAQLIDATPVEEPRLRDLSMMPRCSPAQWPRAPTPLSRVMQTC